MDYLENNLSVQQQKQEIIPEDKELRILDCTGLQCPGPIMKEMCIRDRTCAGSKGNAGYYLKEWCQDKGLQYKGCTQIIMPENYIALYDTTSPELIPEILEQAYHCVLKSVYYIKENKSFSESSMTLKDKVSSGIVNDLFYPLFVQAKKFYGNDNCISCGKCEKLCPLSNIKLIEGQPIWGNHCTHCMACISRCPKGAIEYGKKTKDRIRYVCPK